MKLPPDFEEFLRLLNAKIQNSVQKLTKVDFVSMFKFRFFTPLVFLPLLLCAFVSSPLLADTRVLIIAGKGGTPDYTQKFGGYARKFHETLVSQHGFSADHVTILAETGANLPTARLQCNAQTVEAVFAELAGKLKSDDLVCVVLFGHGTADDLWAKFNLEGPDLRDLDFARLMDALPARRQVFINTTAASAGFIEKLTRPERIIITATRSSAENFTTVFPEYFVEAFTKIEEADLNKDQSLSLLEVFDYARDHVVRFYEEANRLRPEHPLLDDNGDGTGSETPHAGGSASARSDGQLAALTFLRLGPPAESQTSASGQVTGSPLEQKKAKLLAEIETLKAQKQSLPVTEYERKIEELFISLARLNREIKNQNQSER